MQPISGNTIHLKNIALNVPPTKEIDKWVEK